MIFSLIESIWFRLLPRFIRSKIEQSESRQKVLSNFLWLLFDKFLRMGVGFLVGVWLTRYLGPRKYGIFRYSRALVTLLSSFANLGLTDIVVRDLVKEKDSVHEIMGSAFLLKLCGGLLTFLACLLTVRVLHPGDDFALLMVAIIAATLIMRSSDVFDFWFQSQVQSKYSVFAMNGAFLLARAANVALILLTASLVSFAWVLLGEAAVAAAGLALFYCLTRQNPLRWRPSFGRAMSLLRQSWTLILSSVLITIYSRIDQLMLGNMIGSAEVGIYSVAVSISEIWYFFAGSLVSSIFPSIIKLREGNAVLYVKRVQQLHDLLLFFSFSIALFLCFAADPFIVFLFGEEFAASAAPLKIYAWSCVIVFHGVLRSRYFVIEKKQHLLLWLSIIGTTLNILINLLLIPRYRSVGAAWATVISYTLPIFLLSLVNPDARKIAVFNLKSYVLPLRALIHGKGLYR